MFKNYDIVEVFSGDKDDYYDLEIDVTEGVRKWLKKEKNKLLEILL